MKRAISISAAFFIAIAAAPRAALADRGALSLDIGAGGSTMALPAPYAAASGSVQGTALLTSLGLRYALQNWIELATTAFFEVEPKALMVRRNIERFLWISPSSLAPESSLICGHNL